LKLEQDLERSRSASKNDVTLKLHAQVAQYQDQVLKLQRDLRSAKEDADRVEALALKSGQHRTASGPSPSIKALQELHLGSEQMSKSVTEELRRSRLGPLADSNARARGEKNRHSIDFGSMRTTISNLPEDQSNLAATQQKMARDLRQRESRRLP
jgi:hypothetical protein